jgi:hypothetical protein
MESGVLAPFRDPSPAHAGRRGDDRRRYQGALPVPLRRPKELRASTWPFPPGTTRRGPRTKRWWPRWSERAWRTWPPRSRTGLFQARPPPRPPVGEALVWRPTLATSAGTVVAATGLAMAGVAFGTFGLRTPGPSPRGRDRSLCGSWRRSDRSLCGSCHRGSRSLVLMRTAGASDARLPSRRSASPGATCGSLEVRGGSFEERGNPDSAWVACVRSKPRGATLHRVGRSRSTRSPARL